jgi:hypothetical protein
MQKVNDLVIIGHVVYKVDKIPEINRNVREFVIAFFLRVGKKLEADKILTVVDNITLQLVICE